MRCEEAKAKLIPFLEEELDTEQNLILRQHYQDCQDCRKEFLETKKMVDGLSSLPAPEPSPSMEGNFYRMLEGYKRVLKNEEKKWYEKLGDSIQVYWRPVYLLRVAYAIVFITIGWSAARLTDSNESSEDKLVSMSKEINEMKTVMMLTLLKQPSASERLRAVSMTEEITTADEEIIDVLLKTLNNDPNVNVRLVTVDALMNYSNNPKVRGGLVQSLITQDSPIVQLELVDAILALQEKDAVPQLQQLLKDKKLNKSVREKITKNLNTLI